MPTPNAHHKTSASAAHRWMACTAAPTFEANFPDAGTSVYAQEGTLAHSFCELYANKYFTVMTTGTGEHFHAFLQYVYLCVILHDDEHAAV